MDDVSRCQLRSLGGPEGDVSAEGPRRRVTQTGTGPPPYLITLRSVFYLIIYYMEECIVKQTVTGAVIINNRATLPNFTGCMLFWGAH